MTQVGGTRRSGLFRTKSVEQSIRDTDEPDSKLRKDLTAWDLIVFGVAVVIGAGIFTLTARTAGNVAGPSVSLAFVFAAIACALAALCYAEFASTVPVAGSAYTYSFATFGEFVAWIIGWDLILEFALAAAVVAKGWSLYLGEVMGGLSSSFMLGSVKVDWGGAMLITLVIGVLIATGTKLSSRVSLVITSIKIAVVVFVVVLGAFYIKTENYSPFIPPSESGDTGEGLHQSLFSFVTAPVAARSAGTDCSPRPAWCSSRSSGSTWSPRPRRRPATRRRQCRSASSVPSRSSPSCTSRSASSSPAW